MATQLGGSAKKVVFHIGFPKTGSSAIQTFLSANAAALEDAGIAYPYPEPSSVIETGNCTGNLVQIMYRDGFVDRFQNRSGNQSTRLGLVIDESFLSRVVEIIEQSNHATLLFSLETVSAAMPSALRHLKENIADRFDTRLVGFVRDPFDMMYSSWRQGLKTQRTTLSFAEFARKRIAQQSLPMTSGYGKLREAGLSPVLLNYDTYRKDIVGKFFEAADIPIPQAAEYKLSGDGYNISLTPAESDLVQMVNGRFPDRDFSATLTKLLLRRTAAERTGGDFYSSEVDRMILSAAGPVLDEINKIVTGDKLRTTVRPKADTTSTIGSGEIACLLEAFSIAARTAEKGARRPGIYDSAKGVLRWKGGDDMPPDFDAEAYLFHNTDVANAGVDPKLHYLAHGRVEQRRYRFSEVSCLAWLRPQFPKSGTTASVPSDE